jgi:S1-C subfamily serine protease
MDIYKSIVGIRAKASLSAQFAGTGFLVEGGWIITCAHVLKDAERHSSQPSRVRFCLDQPDQFYWAEIILDGDSNELDVAVLKPLNLPQDMLITPLPLMTSSHSQGHTYRTFGYPVTSGGRGIHASDKIEGHGLDPLQRPSLQISSNKITHGYSGAPLWDEDAGGVVGMVNAGFEFGLDKKLGDVVFAIPVETLQAAFSELHVLPARAASPSPTLPGDLPHGSHLPFPRNGFFTGRAENLKKLAETLLGDPLLPGVVINQALSGMGGVGKTQLAVEFAYEYGHHFKGVHWLDLRDPQAIDSQIALCGEKMGLPAWPPTLPEQVTATLGEWHKNHPRLLILDNFEDLAEANPVLARLRHSGLRLLLTSRLSPLTARRIQPGRKPGLFAQIPA